MTFHFIYKYICVYRKKIIHTYFLLIDQINLKCKQQTQNVVEYFLMIFFLNFMELACHEPKFR